MPQQIKRAIIGGSKGHDEGFFGERERCRLDIKVAYTAEQNT